jgi:Ca-activated chloride channel family protein
VTLLWPWALLGFLALPLLVVLRRRLTARQRERRLVLARDGLAVTASPADRWQRVSATLLLVGLALLLLSIARPVASVAEPRREGTVVLAFDVSTSMAATDISPTRLDAAKTAARGFVEKQPPSVRLGVVAFGGSGVVAEPPTTDRSAVLAAIARLAPQGDTSLGRGVLGALSAIAGKPITKVGDSETGTAAESPIGYYGGTAIVLLTDGEDTGGPDPQEVAELASAAGVRIEPIGLGTPEGSVLEVDGFSIATSLDEAALAQMAETTGGTYRSADDASSLASVYEAVELTWTVRTVPHEVTSVLAALASLLLAAAVTMSVLRLGRVV